LKPQNSVNSKDASQLSFANNLTRTAFSFEILLEGLQFTIMSHDAPLVVSRL